MKTTDLCDSYPDKVIVAQSAGLKNFGGNKSFCGEIHTVKCFENNPFVRNALEKSGEGKVLVVDGGGSVKVALLGDMLCEIAVNNKWSGIIVNGCIRDSAEISKLGIGVKALDTIPIKSGKKNAGEENITVSFAGIDFISGQYVYCDDDGIIVSVEKLFFKTD